MSKRTAEHIMRSFMAFLLLIMLMSGFDGKFLLDYTFPQPLASFIKLFVFFLLIWLAFGKLRSARNQVAKQ